MFPVESTPSTRSITDIAQAKRQLTIAGVRVVPLHVPGPHLLPLLIAELIAAVSSVIPSPGSALVTLPKLSTRLTFSSKTRLNISINLIGRVWIEG